MSGPRGQERSSFKAGHSLNRLRVFNKDFVVKTSNVCDFFIGKIGDFSIKNTVQYEIKPLYMYNKWNL